MNSFVIIIISSENHLIGHESIKEALKTALLPYGDFLELRRTSFHLYLNTADQAALNIA